MNFTIFDADAIKRAVKETLGKEISIHDPCGGNLYFTLTEPDEAVAALVAEKMAAFGKTTEVSADGLLISIR